MAGIAVCGALLLAFGATVVAYSWSYGLGQLSQPGTGFFGVLAGAGVCVLAALYLAQEWLSRNDASHEAPQVGATDGRALLVILVLWIYVLAMPWLGFALATCIVMTILFRMAGTATWARSVALGAGAGIAAALIFGVVLDLKLPKGMLVA